MRYTIIMPTWTWIEGSVTTNNRNLATRLARFLRAENIFAYVVDSDTNLRYFPSTKQWVDQASAKLILDHQNPRSNKEAQDAILKEL